MKRSLRHMAAALALVTLASEAQELRIAMGADVTSVDPHFVNLQPNNNIAENVFDTLVNRDADNRLIPALAESWTLIEPTLWEFRLRKGARFHDGSMATAEDVVFSIERVGKIVNSPGPFTVYTKAIKESIVVDSYTVRFRTATVYPLLPNDLSLIYIVSKQAASGVSTEEMNSGKGLVGTGPFKFVAYRKGDRVELERHEGYWGAKPAWQKVTFRILPSDPTRVAALLAGDVDAIENIPTADFKKIKADPKFDTATKTSHRVIFFHVDQFRDPTPFASDKKTGKPLEKNPLRDLRVRQAISKAIDREAIKTRVMEGLALPTANLVPAPMFGHNPALAPEKFDPEGAKKLLAEAGYGDGFALTLHGPNNRYVNDDQILQAVAAMLQRIGIATKVEAMPMNVYLGRASKLEFSVPMLGWGSSTAESSGPLRSHLATYNAETGMGAFAWGRYSNREFDELLAKALATPDDKARERLLQDATAIAIGELGIIPLHHQINTWAMRKGIAYTPRTDEYTLAHQFRQR